MIDQFSDKEPMKKKSFQQMIWDFFGIPFRLVLFDQSWLPRFGWTTLERERIMAVWPHIHGRLLDIGAGPNTLVNCYQNGVGVDVFDWGGGALVVENTAYLPFASTQFDTITFLACLNHIPNRDEVLREARRLIRPNGRLIITMIDPVLGNIGHAIWWYGEDRHRGGMKSEELGGMWTKDIIARCEAAGFRLQTHHRFVHGMNHLYQFVPVGEKA
jgi:SAM-dependent methyltransferase